MLPLIGSAAGGSSYPLSCLTGTAGSAAFAPFGPHDTVFSLQFGENLRCRSIRTVTNFTDMEDEVTVSGDPFHYTMTLPNRQIAAMKPQSNVSFARAIRVDFNRKACRLFAPQFILNPIWAARSAETGQAGTFSSLRRSVIAGCRATGDSEEAPLHAPPFWSSEVKLRTP
jgi:hypothetical protein